LAVIVNKNNPVTNIRIEDLRRILLGEMRQWETRQRVTVVQRDPSSLAFQTSLELVVRMTPAEYRRSLLHGEFRGDAPVAIKTLNTPSGACEFVFNVPGAVGIVEADVALMPPCMELAKVIPVNNKRPGEAGYFLQ
jgi:ABC-type phosphate transport system substrate-binding protein